MVNLKKSLDNQGLEYSRILSLKRAGLLNEKNIQRFIKTPEGRKAASALMKMEKNLVEHEDVSTRSLYKAVENLA